MADTLRKVLRSLKQGVDTVIRRFTDRRFKERFGRLRRAKATWMQNWSRGQEQEFRCERER